MRIMALKTFALVLVVLLAFVYESSAIHCYYCNSANNSACLDPNELDDEVRARVIPIVDCALAVPRSISVKFFCRKIIQTIYHTRRDNDVRVTRGCGWIPSQKECYRADNSDHLETVCQCFSDHCNSGDHVNPDSAVALFLLFSSVLYFYR